MMEFIHQQSAVVESTFKCNVVFDENEVKERDEKDNKCEFSRMKEKVELKEFNVNVINNEFCGRSFLK